MSSPLHHIRVQAAAMAAVGNTLSHVAVAATYSDPRAILRTTWRINARDKRADSGVETVIRGRSEDIIILLPRCTEAEILDTAWLLGAWDVLRTEHAPIPRTQTEARAAGYVCQVPNSMLGDLYSPAWGIAAAFCGCPYAIGGESAAHGECPQDLIALAAAEGWITWAFRPTVWSARVGSNDDRTLNPDGTRDPREMPIMPVPLADRPHRHVYRLGRAPHGNRSVRKKNRRAA